MVQVINDENDYKLTRGKMATDGGAASGVNGPVDMGSHNNQAHVETQQPVQFHSQLDLLNLEGTRSTARSVRRKKVDQSHAGHDDIEQEDRVVDEKPSMERTYLGDISSQYGTMGKPPPAQTTLGKRKPLGGDSAPLQQQPQHRKSNIIGNDLTIPTRLPQKRQATESSTNLVEKLNLNDYKKSKVIDYQWDDLDEEDMDDPLMVSEYVNDIYPYLHELEYKTLPDSQYIFKQKHLKPKMRSILVDWLVEMHSRFRLLPETLYLAINIMDRFMSVEIVQIDKLQLLATGSLFIAAKYEEVFSPSVKNYSYFTDGSYTEDEILQAEKYILTILDFELNYPNPMNFLRRISKADSYDVQTRTLGKYLLEITVIDYKFIGMLPSLCSACSMYIARSIMGKTPTWNGNLIHYSGGYKVEDMKDCINLIIQYLISPIEHDEFFKKYSTKKFMKASILCRSWAKKIIAEKKNIFDD